MIFFMILYYIQLEIFHGVLNNPDAAKKRSFFYLRKPPVEGELDEKQYKVANIDLEEIYKMSRGKRFPTMWHFDMNRLRRACAASF